MYVLEPNMFSMTEASWSLPALLKELTGGLKKIQRSLDTNILVGSTHSIFQGSEFCISIG